MVIFFPLPTWLNRSMTYGSKKVQCPNFSMETFSSRSPFHMRARGAVKTLANPLSSPRLHSPPSTLSSRASLIAPPPPPPPPPLSACLLSRSRRRTERRRHIVRRWRRRTRAAAPSCPRMADVFLAAAAAPLPRLLCDASSSSLLPLQSWRWRPGREAAAGPGRAAAAGNGEAAGLGERPRRLQPPHARSWFFFI